jgi:hypothetical protein
MSRYSAMKLNNDVEEAIESGEGHCADSDGCRSPSIAGFAAFTTSGAAEVLERASALKINHAEDEHYGASRYA